MRAVSFPGTTIELLHKLFKVPPFLPSKPKFCILSSFATSIQFTKFLLLPDVDITTSRSPLFPMASNCLLYTKSKPKSFPIAVNAEVSVASEIARPQSGQPIARARRRESAALSHPRRSRQSCTLGTQLRLAGESIQGAWRAGHSGSHQRSRSQHVARLV